VTPKGESVWPANRLRVPFWLLGCACWSLLWVFPAKPIWADDTFVYAVQLSAAVQISPPQITLNWEPDPFGATNYTVYRKSKSATDWGAALAVLDGSTNSYADSNVIAGSSYEYKVVKAALLGYTGYGYIFSGINAPLTEDRGKVVLVVETNAASSLSNELARLACDLVGDGWQVVRHDVSSNDSPVSVRSAITNDYYAEPDRVNTVFLFGHVPVLESGYLNYDGHETRTMPADAYYAEVNDDWPTDPEPTNRPSFLPSDAQLMVGRVDFFNLPGAGAATPWPSETELLRNYLNKDHNWRHALIQVPHLALMGNFRGDEGGDATAASGYRNFEPFVGPGNIIEANVEYDAPDNERWISMLGAGSYLWAYGCGGGSPDSCGGLGTAVVGGVPGDLSSVEVVAQDPKVPFVMLFGSWFGAWDFSDDLMRSFLAAPSMVLSCCLAGGPHWFVHHMGLGETIGYSTRLTLNNDRLYQNESNDFTRAVYIALMGDPTLRMEPVAPPSGLTAKASLGAVTLAWSSSTGSVEGYHVYRATSPAGPFTRLTSALLADTSYTDTTASAGTNTYMVRAIALETNFSGTYFNPSQGEFVTVNSPSPITLQSTLGASTVQLSWNCERGVVYRVLAKNSLDDTNWTDISGAMVATGPMLLWTDEDISSRPQRFYRIASP
jgi:hypothetical protein